MWSLLDRGPFSWNWEVRVSSHPFSVTTGRLIHASVWSGGWGRFQKVPSCPSYLGHVFETFSNDFHLFSLKVFSIKLNVCVVCYLWVVVGCYLFVYVNLLLCTCVYVANLYMFSIQVFRLYNLLVWLETNPHFGGGLAMFMHGQVLVQCQSMEGVGRLDAR